MPATSPYLVPVHDLMHRPGDELSVVKVEDNPAHVAAALLVLQVAPDIAAADGAS